MKGTDRSKRLALTACLTVAGVALTLTAARGQERIFEYAAKFVCGRSAPTPTAPSPLAQGIYYTDINVHNPGTAPVEFRKKFAVALPDQKAGPISEFARGALKADEALSVECAEITKRLNLPPGRFVTGFAVFQTPRELDIVAVYTTAANAAGFVSTMHMERVPKRP